MSRPDSAEAPRARVGLGRLVAYFLRLGATGFGGPIALAEHMKRDLVEARGWISKRDYLQGLAFAQLAPGPLATQLAIYLGYVHSGAAGATATAVTFVLPSFLMVIALAAAYAHYGVMAVVTAVGGKELGALFVLCGVVSWLYHVPPRWLGR